MTEFSILPGLLGLIAVALLAAATPRQAEILFGRSFDEGRRKRARLLGFALLAAGVAVIVDGGDIARPLVGWIGLLGIEALTVSLIITAIARYRKKPRKT